MKKQINFGLFLLLVFIIWLFVNMYSNFSLRQSKLALERERLDFNYAKLEQERENRQRYTIFSGSEIVSVPIMYDKTTGEAYKFFMNAEDKNIGWEPLLYKGYSVRGSTPEIWKYNVENMVQEAQNKLKLNSTDNLKCYNEQGYLIPDDKISEYEFPTVLTDEQIEGKEPIVLKRKSNE